MEEITKLIENIDEKALAEYLTADFGEWFGLYADGTHAVGENIGNEINPDERPIACVKCPGISNISESFFTDGWTEYNHENGMYKTDDGRELTFEECIRECCKSGDVTDEIEMFKEKLAEQSA